MRHREKKVDRHNVPAYHKSHLYVLACTGKMCTGVQWVYLLNVSPPDNILYSLIVIGMVKLFSTYLHGLRVENSVNRRFVVTNAPLSYRFRYNTNKINQSLKISFSLKTRELTKTQLDRHTKTGACSRSTNEFFVFQPFVRLRLKVNVQNNNCSRPVPPPVLQRPGNVELF